MENQSITDLIADLKAGKSFPCTTELRELAEQAVQQKPQDTSIEVWAAILANDICQKGNLWILLHQKQARMVYLQFRSILEMLVYELPAMAK